MGPRPDGRGRLIHYVVGSAEVTRFNGAAAGWPRKVVMQIDRLVPKFELQWGRGRMAAEGSVPRRRVVGEGGLQWGRGRMAAEGWTWTAGTC